MTESCINLMKPTKKKILLELICELVMVADYKVI